MFGEYMYIFYKMDNVLDSIFCKLFTLHAGLEIQLTPT